MAKNPPSWQSDFLRVVLPSVKELVFAVPLLWTMGPDVAGWFNPANEEAVKVWQGPLAFSEHPTLWTVGLAIVYCAMVGAKAANRMQLVRADSDESAATNGRKLSSALEKLSESERLRKEDTRRHEEQRKESRRRLRAQIAQGRKEREALATATSDPLRVFLAECDDIAERALPLAMPFLFDNKEDTSAEALWEELIELVNSAVYPARAGELEVEMIDSLVSIPKSEQGKANPMGVADRVRDWASDLRVMVSKDPSMLRPVRKSARPTS